MNCLTISLGKFPLGIWVVLILLCFLLVFGPGGQAISVFSWDTALSLGLQEDNPESSDALEVAMVPVEWGTAVADVILQTTLIVLSLTGLFRRHWIGFVAASVQFSVIIYAGLFFFFQRYGIKALGIGDWTHWEGIAKAFLIFAESTGLIGIICLWSNRKYYGIA